MDVAVATQIELLLYMWCVKDVLTAAVVKYIGRHLDRHSRLGLLVCVLMLTSHQAPRIAAGFRLTFSAEVVDHDDLVQVLRRRRGDDAVNGAHQRRPALVVKDDDDAGGRQVFRVVPVATPSDGGKKSS